jgi:curved DNA-binding protein CbpA
MKNLYELLGAFPDDDADRLRAAFHKAAKANHPDSNPDDPDASLRFRRTVRANAILRDEQLRTTYDWLLAAAHHERGLNSRRGSRIDRAIVLHRMGGLKHAFADIAQAKRIDDSNRSRDRLPH